MRKVFGVILLFFGIFLIALSNSSITGSLISENLGELKYPLAIALIIIGIFLMTFPSTLEQKVIPSNERNEIKNAFRQWDGRITSAQKHIIKKYGLKTEKTGSGHIAFFFPYSHKKVYTSSTSSDHRAGLNFALKELIPYIQEEYIEHVS